MSGWNINATADTISFVEAPPVGTNNILVQEFPVGGAGGTDAWAMGSWSGTNGWPTEVEFFSDRLWFAGSTSDPQTIWGSQTGDYTNFGKSTPIVDSDAVTFTINSRQVNAVMDLIPLDKMLILTKNAEFLMTGGADQVVTPSSISIRPQSYRGTGGVQARVVGETALFVQEQGQHVYDVGYKFESDGYRPTDLSIWADHLAEGYRFIRMEWMPAPWSCLWLVRNDGIKVGLTYMPEQEAIGWHRHDTQGEFVDVACLPGVEQTASYALVSRTINGVQRVSFEQMAPVFVTDPKDWFYVDSGLTYDGRNTSAETMTLTGSGWGENDDLTLTRSSGAFVSTDIGDAAKINVVALETDPTTGEMSSVSHSVRVVIVAVNGSNATVNPIGEVHSSLRGSISSDWMFMRDTIGGLEHLNGALVSILTDGSAHPDLVVSNGKVTLDYPAGVVHIGLPYRAEIETLQLSSAGDVVRDKRKLVYRVGVLVKGTRGLKMGPNDRHLDEFKEREFEAWAEPTMPTTGYQEMNISAEWGVDNGTFKVVSDVPLPAEILALIPKTVASDAV